MKYLIDPPGPWASEQEWLDFIEDLKMLDQDDCLVRSELRKARKMLADARAGKNIFPPQE